MSKPSGIFFSNYVVFSENLNFKAQARAVKSQAEAEKLQVIVHSSSLDCFHIHQDHWKKKKSQPAGVPTHVQLRKLFLVVDVLVTSVACHWFMHTSLLHGDLADFFQLVY